MSKPKPEQIRPIKYPKQGKDTRQGVSYRTAEEIQRINLPEPEPQVPQQSALFNRYFNGGQ